MTISTVLIVSGGTGSSGNQLVQTALAQFQHSETVIILIPQVQQPEQVEAIMHQASAAGALIVHTLVDAEVRSRLIELARQQHIIQIDLMGPLLSNLQSLLHQSPVGLPGLYRKMRERDLKRIEAIEFAVEHDDGQRTHELSRAEIVLTGVSRVGKTPLSVYLSTLGWKVANVPLVQGIQPPPELFAVDHRRVIGLMVDPGQLVAYRQRRQQHLGTMTTSPYSDPHELVEELEFARQIFRRGQFATINMTDKPVEEGAQEITNLINRTFSCSDPD